MTSRYLLSKVEAVPGKDVLNPRDYSFGEGSLDGAFVIYRLRKAYPSMSYKRLFNLSDHEVQQWKPFQHVNAEYPLDHLDACKLVFQHPKRNERYTLFFTFSHHVFTRGIKSDESPDVIDIYPFPSDKRLFDKTRYELSKHLPQIIATLPNQFCYHGGYSRYCSCKIKQDNGIEIYYQVVYRVWKEHGKIRFHIESAYLLNEKLGRVKKVDFWVICHNLLHSKKLPKPSLK